MIITNYCLGTDSKDNYINTINNGNINLLVKKYSMAKYGSFKDIKILANIIIKNIFKEIDNKQSKFRNILELAKNNNDHIVLITPGYKNVKSSANIIFDIVLPHINTKLASMGFTIITKLKLPRLSSPCENYASLTAKERKGIGLVTDHILPGHSFYKNNNIHVIYGDDILTTGTSSNKAKKDIILKGAKSFTSIFLMIIDEGTVKNNCAIEEQINKFKVTEKLDATASEIFTQSDFIPVLRSFRILLNKNNLNDLKNFLNEIPIHNILKVYIAYITNEYLDNEKYTQSFELIKKYLISKNQIMPCGNLKIGI